MKVTANAKSITVENARGEKFSVVVNNREIALHLNVANSDVKHVREIQKSINNYLTSLGSKLAWSQRFHKLGQYIGSMDKVNSFKVMGNRLAERIEEEETELATA